MVQKPPSRVELLRGTLDLLILRTLLPGPSEKGKRARYYRIKSTGRKQLDSEQSKLDAFASAMGLLLKPADEEGR